MIYGNFYYTWAEGNNETIMPKAKPLSKQQILGAC